MNGIRLFLAIALPDAVKDAMEMAQMEMRRALPEGCVRWTGREQMHLTLKFLGDVEVERVPHLAEVVQNACRGFGAMKLRAERIGFFPNAHAPRVIWAGVHDEDERLPRLYDALDRATREFAAESSERHFQGHVTFGRVKAIRREESAILTRMEVSLIERVFGEWEADEVELIQSRLSSTGSQYSVQAVARLAKA